MERLAPPQHERLGCALEHSGLAALLESRADACRDVQPLQSQRPGRNETGRFDPLQGVMRQPDAGEQDPAVVSDRLGREVPVLVARGPVGMRDEPEAARRVRASLQVHDLADDAPESRGRC